MKLKENINLSLDIQLIDYLKKDAQVRGISLSKLVNEMLNFSQTIWLYHSMLRDKNPQEYYRVLERKEMMEDTVKGLKGG